MDISDQVLIIQNPDGTIQIGTQPHLKNRKIMDCYKCRAQIIFEAQYTTLKCTRCGTINQVPGTQPAIPPQSIQCAVCKRPAPITRAEDITYAHCLFCGSITGIL